MQKGKYAGVVYWLIFLGLVVWAVDRDLSTPTPLVQSAELSGVAQDMISPIELKHETKNLWARTTEDPVAFFTLWLAMFTGVLAFSTIGLWIVTLRAARRQSEDMQRSIDIATKTMELTERSFTDLERALVIINKVNSSRIYIDSKVAGYAIDVLFVNTGRTAALRYQAHTNFAMFSQNPPSDFKYPDRSRSNHQRLQTLGPGVISNTPIAVAMEDIITISRGGGQGYLYGWAEYDDIFNRSTRRRTEFCFRLDLFGDPTVDRHPISGNALGPPFGYAPFGSYNGVDEDCLYEPETTPLAKPGELPPLTPLKERARNFEL